MTFPKNQEPCFSAPPHTITCDGMLFDMDGTIIDSTEAVIKNWQRNLGKFGQLPLASNEAKISTSVYPAPFRLHADEIRIGKEIGVDPEIILATSHGRRSIDVLKIYEPKLANWDYIGEKEGQIPREFGADAVEIPGSRSFLEELEKQSIPWAIVTSGTRPLVTGWLDVLKLAHPKNLVVAEDVQRGKPDPACYLLGREKLALPKEEPSIVVFEDAPAGVKSGKAAGFKVVALHTTHTLEQLKEAGADFIIRDMRSVSLKAWSKATGEAQLEISNALVW